MDKDPISILRRFTLEMEALGVSITGIEVANRSDELALIAACNWQGPLIEGTASAMRINGTAITVGNNKSKVKRRYPLTRKDRDALFGPGYQSKLD